MYIFQCLYILGQMTNMDFMAAQVYLPYGYYFHKILDIYAFANYN